MAGSGFTQSTSMNTIPNEILTLIFCHLVEDTALLHLALVCRRFKAVVEPLKYHTIKLYLGSPTSLEGLTDGKQHASNIHRFDHLVSTLSENIQLRGKVSQLSIEAFLHPDHEDFRSQNTLLDLIPALRSLTLRPPRPDLDISALLSLRNLELNFDPDGCGYDHYPSEPQLFFRHSMAYFSQVINLPNLRSLSVIGVSFCKADAIQNILSDHPRSSPIKYLRLMRNQDSRVGIIPHILRCIAALEQFTLETHREYMYEDSLHQNVAPSEIGLAVSQHEDSLIELNIALSDAASFPRSSLFGSLAAFGSLAGYSKLRRLAIPEEFLCAPTDQTYQETLPPSLEELQVQYSFGHEWGNPSGDTSLEYLRSSRRLERLLSTRKLFLPRFRRVACWDNHGDSWDQHGGCFSKHPDLMGRMCECEENIERLKAVSQGERIRFEFTSCPSWPNSPFGVEDA